MIPGVPPEIWNRWTTFWWMLRAPGDPRAPLEDLAKRYGDPHRWYHTFDHILHCLRELDTIRDHLDFAQLMIVEGALWYHDAVYDPRAKDNKEQSDVLMANALNGFPDAVIREPIDNLIRASTHRRVFTDAVAPGDPTFPIAAFLDIDLSILGQDEATYDAYAAAIRREYAHVSDEDFRAGRAAVMEAFLKRPRIYATSIFHVKYEAQALMNIAREIAQLRAT